MTLVNLVDSEIAGNVIDHVLTSASRSLRQQHLRFLLKNANAHRH